MGWFLLMFWSWWRLDASLNMSSATEDYYYLLLLFHGIPSRQNKTKMAYVLVRACDADSLRGSHHVLSSMTNCCRRVCVCVLTHWWCPFYTRRANNLDGVRWRRTVPAEGRLASHRGSDGTDGAFLLLLPHPVSSSRARMPFSPTNTHTHTRNNRAKTHYRNNRGWHNEQGLARSRLSKVFPVTWTTAHNTHTLSLPAPPHQILISPSVPMWTCV